MLETHGMTIANQAGVTPRQVEAVRSLLDAGATIPFIARYRKEKTGSLDEVVLSEIRDGLARLAALDSRRQAILESLEEQNVLTAGLRSSVESAATLTALEDGLVHISELSDKFVKNPADVVRVNQKVSVTVLTIDPERKRISLSMRSDASPPGQPGSDT